MSSIARSSRPGLSCCPTSAASRRTPTSKSKSPNRTDESDASRCPSAWAMPTRSSRRLGRPPSAAIRMQAIPVERVHPRYSPPVKSLSHRSTIYACRPPRSRPPAIFMRASKERFRRNPEHGLQAECAIREWLARAKDISSSYKARPESEETCSHPPHGCRARFAIPRQMSRSDRLAMQPEPVKPSIRRTRRSTGPIRVGVALRMACRTTVSSAHRTPYLTR